MRLNMMNCVDDLFVEPEWRVLRPEECIPLEDVCIRLHECVCVRPGPVSDEVLGILGQKRYDHAPVYDAESKTCYGLAHTSYLQRLLKEGANLKADDPHVCDENKYFRVGVHTNIYQLVNKLKSESAVIVIQESDATEYGHAEFLLGLFTISDLNRHEIRSVLYRLFSDVESEIAKLVERDIPEPWEWITLLAEEQQVRILGYWELAKRRNMDIGPIAATTLTNLLTIVGKSPGLRNLFGFRSRKEFDKYSGKLPEFRNRIMHPVRPVVLDQQDVKELYAVVRFLEKLKNRAIEVLKPETKA